MSQSPSNEKTSLDTLLAQCVAETPDVKQRGTEISRGDVAFAARPSADTVELRLGEEIGEAALRTQDTHPSARGSEWVTLKSDDWGSARDRLEAWYRVAWRLAAKAKR